MKKILRPILTVLLLAIVISSLAACDALVALISPSEECNHAWREATCTAPKTCRKCLLTDGEALPHSYTEEVVAPTCIKDGYTLVKCSECGESHKESTVPTTGHVISDWIFDKQPTDTEAGEKHKECTVCGKVTETEKIEAHVHTMESVPALAPTCEEMGYEAHERCSVCGYSDNHETTPALGHAWGEWISGDNGTHSRACSNDPAHVETESCSGGDSSADELICAVCGGSYDYAPAPGNSRYGYDFLGKHAKGEAMQSLYKKLQASAEAFAVSEDNVSKTESYYVIGEHDYATLGLTSDEAMGVWKMFYVDNPSYYWLSSIAVTYGDDLLLTVDHDYIYAEYRAEYDIAIAEMVADSALIMTPGLSELEKAVRITDYIVTGMEYAYEDDGVTPVSAIWAHNIVGFAQYGYGVCETYAKTFMYLCSLNGIECIMGTGLADGESHAWNYVRIDGVWYGADITWTDTAGDEARFDRFGMSDSLIHSNHVLHGSDTFGVDFIYEIPEISDTSIELTELRKDGEGLGLYPSIEAAILDMTDKDAVYELYIGFYGDFVGAEEHDLKLTELPNVKKLTITGINKFVGEGYLDQNSALNIAADLKLNGNVVFKNLNVKGEGTIDLNNNKLTLAGNSVYVSLKVNGTTEGSEIEVLSSRHACLNGAVNAYLVTVDSTLIFGADSTVTNYNGESVFTSGGATVNITNRI